MAVLERDIVAKEFDNYGKGVIRLPWFKEYEKERIKQSTLKASEIVQEIGLQGDISSGVHKLMSQYELTEIQSKQLLEAVKSKLWHKISDGENTASSEGKLDLDEVIYTDRTVSYKDKTYKLGPILGKGGFGVVRLGGHPTNPRKKYALKFISKKHMKSNIHFVKREISCMKKVTHQNVLRLYRFGNVDYPHEDGTFDPSMLLVTEYCPNGELFDIIFYCQDGMSETLTRTFFHQLMEGLAAIHSVNVFHRDIKPQNLLLNSRFVLKICDFGLSNVWNEKDLLNTKVGTRGFMAPEMIMKFAYNAAVDVFSAGVVLFNMITGVCPFRTADPNKDVYYYRVATKDERFWKNHPHLDRSLKDLIEGMLAYQPADRMDQAKIEENDWYKGPIHKPEGLEAEMVNIHRDCVLKKGEDKSTEVDVNSFFCRDVGNIPVIHADDVPKYMTGFHTFQISEGSEKECFTMLTYCLTNSVGKKQHNYKVSADRTVQTVKFTHIDENEVSHEVILQVRAFKLEPEKARAFKLEEGHEDPVFLTIFRVSGDPEIFKEYLKIVDPVLAFCHRPDNQCVEEDYDSEDDYDLENDSDYLEEEAEAYAQLLAEKRENNTNVVNMGEN